MAFTISNNSPSAGYIAWSGLNVQFAGVSYAIANGYTDKIYAYWTLAYPNNLVVSDDFPELTLNDCLVFLNKNGIAITVPTATITDGDLIVPGSIVTKALAAECVTSDKILAGSIEAGHISANAIGAEAIAAGVILGDHIHSGTITGDKIVVGAITTGHLAAESVKANKIDVDDLFAAAAFINKLKTTELFSESSLLDIYAKQEDITLYLRIDASRNKATLGRSGSDVVIELIPGGTGTDPGLYIKENGTPLAQFTRTLAVMKRMEVSDSILFPHHVVKAMSNGDLAFMPR